MSRKSMVTHNSSILLNEEENKEIFKLLSGGQTSLATAVIQLLVTVEPKHSEWQLYSVGVMCFVKNSRKRSYFFHFYDFHKRQIIWTQEVYLKLNYMQIESTFHSFEADKCMVGLNFADEAEAIYFGIAVNEKMNVINKMFANIEKQDNDLDNKYLKLPNTIGKSRSLDSLKTESIKYNTGIFTKTKKSKLKLSKLDIGMPTNFKHIQHIGWNASTGFDFNIIDPKLESFFNNAGVSKDLLNDADTRKFIYNFIDTHGGIEAAIQESNQPLKHEKENNLGLNKHKHNVLKSKVYTKTSIDDNELPLPPHPPPLPPLQPPPQSNATPILINNESHNKSSVQQDCNDNDSRDELLSQIRQGMKLKTAKTKSCEQLDSVNTKDVMSDSLADALSKALHNRFRVNQLQDNIASDDSDSNSDFEDNQWNN